MGRKAAKPVRRLVKDLEDLKAICLGLDGSRGEFAILLNGGARSSKSITFEEPGWTVWNSIDDTWQEFKTDAAFLGDQSMIGEALSKKALVWDGY